VLGIVLIAVICGAEDREDIVEFGLGKESWLRTFLELKHGVPSADTFRRIALSMLKRETTNKRGIKSKRLRADWDEGYLLKLLAT
jgi:hypothetical protein